MSTASTVTTSAVCDSTLGDEHKIANCICILVATQGDSTPFPHDSFQEEDLVELCIGLSQTHPEGVLQLLETEAVLTFQSTSEMMAAVYPFGAAMVWHDDPITICPPTSTQVREYVAVRSRCTSGTQVQISGEEAVSQSPPLSPTLKGAPITVPYGPQRP